MKYVLLPVLLLHGGYASADNSSYEAAANSLGQIEENGHWIPGIDWYPKTQKDITRVSEEQRAIASENLQGCIGALENAGY
ncbi:MAG: hypothetical protein V3T17_11710 [Pseudomonadales bacterium]